MKPHRCAPGRRRLLLGLPALLLAPPLRALMPDAGQAPEARLDTRQSRVFRSWFVLIVDEQIRRGPTPRWVHRDCAGLVRFAAGEALADHDPRWRHAMGLGGPLPPPLQLSPGQAALRHAWRRADGSIGAFADALALIQENARPVGRDLHLARPGDLLFFDQGEDRHLMVWTGHALVYHNGARPTPGDNGLRAVSPGRLLAWQDTRWRPEAANPNFIGVFQFAFLT